MLCLLKKCWLWSAERPVHMPLSQQPAGVQTVWNTCVGSKTPTLMVMKITAGMKAQLLTHWQRLGDFPLQQQSTQLQLSFIRTFFTIYFRGFTAGLENLHGDKPFSQASSKCKNGCYLFVKAPEMELLKQCKYTYENYLFRDGTHTELHRIQRVNLSQLIS